ncbi:MAG TPA: hypothetical protein VLH83_01265 [Chthoniobacterales bacterium]|nr:hypothetical protein [Chthoniobacterales bacterium]
MKTKQWFGSVIAIALLGAFVSVAASAADAQKTTTTTTVTKTRVAKVNKTGWWIRIDTEKTVASSISFQVGLTRADRKDWRTWTAGEPAEFDLAEMRLWPKLHIRAKTDPKNKKAVFCVFYGDHGVEHFKFDGDKDDNMKSTHKDNDCHP